MFKKFRDLLNMLNDGIFKALLKKHEKFILSIVDKYDFNIMSKEHLVIAGKLGFYLAYDNYKENSNATLLTYSYEYIKREVINQQNELRHSHFSDTQLDKYQKIDAYIKENYRDYSSEIDFDSLEDKTGLDMDDIIRLYVFGSFRILLDNINKSNEDTFSSLSEKIEQKILKEPSVETEAFFLNEEINKRLKILTDNQKLVINKLYGFNDSFVFEIHEIAAELKLSGSRVGQIKEEAKRKLRNDPIMKQIYVEQFYESYFHGYDIDTYSFDN